jgi:hypothetical protein
MYGWGKGGTYGIITDTDCRRDICKRPKAALGEVDAFLLQVLEFLRILSVLTLVRPRKLYSHRMRLSSHGSTGQSFLQVP